MYVGKIAWLRAGFFRELLWCYIPIFLSLCMTVNLIQQMKFDNRKLCRKRMNYTYVWCICMRMMWVYVITYINTGVRTYNLHTIFPHCCSPHDGCVHANLCIYACACKHILYVLMQIYSCICTNKYWLISRWCIVRRTHAVTYMNACIRTYSLHSIFLHRCSPHYEYRGWNIVWCLYVRIVYICMLFRSGGSIGPHAFDKTTTCH